MAKIIIGGVSATLTGFRQGKPTWELNGKATGKLRRRMKLVAATVAASQKRKELECIALSTKLWLDAEEPRLTSIQIDQAQEWADRWLDHSDGRTVISALTRQLEAGHSHTRAVHLLLARQTAFMRACDVF